MLPPSRHNPNPNPRGRHPRVAGLRKPGESSRPTPRPRPAPPEHADEDPAGPQSPGQETAAPSETEPRTERVAPTEDAESAEDVERADSSADEAAGTHGRHAEQPGAQPEPDEHAAAVDGGEAVAEEPAAKPSPRPKKRSAASDKPAGEQEMVGAAAPGTPPARLVAARPGKSRRRLSNKASYLLAAGLLVLAAAFTTGAVFAKMGYSDIAEATDNSALLNVSKTQDVKKAAKSAAEQLFSFDYRHIGKTEKAAKKLLANKEVQHKYSTLMDEVKRLAPKQQIVVQVTATEAAVVEMHDDTARVMVYVDQTSTRTKSKQSSAGGAAMWLQTELRDGTWKVVGMDTYSSGDPMKPNKQGGKQQGAKQGGAGKSAPPKPPGN